MQAAQAKCYLIYFSTGTPSRQELALLYNSQFTLTVPKPATL